MTQNQHKLKPRLVASYDIRHPGVDDGSTDSCVLCAVDDGKSYVLSVALAIGDVLLMSNYDDICPKVIHTSLTGLLQLFLRELWCLFIIH